jgi:hypothetical protein
LQGPLDRLALDQIIQCARQPASIHDSLWEIILRTAADGRSSGFLIICFRKYQNHSVRRCPDDLIENHDPASIGKRQVKQDNVYSPGTKTRDGVGKTGDVIDVEGAISRFRQSLFDPSDLGRVILDKENGSRRCVHGMVSSEEGKDADNV